MRFPHFWHFARPAPLSDPDDWYASSRAWRDSGLAEEVEEFLAGRLVNHLTAIRQPMPTWAVLNRLAHAAHSDLLRLVEGAADWSAPPTGGRTHPTGKRTGLRQSGSWPLTCWRGPARPTTWGQLQRAALAPIELVLIERTKFERLTADQVLRLGAEAVDSFYPGG